MIPKQKFHKSLPCVLTQEEIINKAKEMTEQMGVLCDLENRKKEAMSDFLAKQKSCEANINSSRQIVYSGKEYRNIECYLEFDFEKNIKQLIRTDTGEIYETQTISSEEKQEHLELE